MERIPFDIKYRPEIEAGKYLVETREGVSVRIICWERKGYYPPIIALLDIKASEIVYTYTEKGKYGDSGAESHLDLFLVPNPDYKEPTTTCSTSEPSEAAVWAAVGAFKPSIWKSEASGKYRLTITAYRISRLCERCFMGEGPTIYAAAVEVYKQLMAED